MRPVPEQLKWARNLTAPESLLSQTRKKIGHDGDETSDFYWGFLTILILARALYYELFLKTSSLPYVQKKNQGPIAIFLTWTEVGFQHCLSLIPTDAHWGASGSPAKKTELEVRWLQARGERPLQMPPQVKVPDFVIEGMKGQLSSMIVAGDKPDGYLGGLQGFSAAYTLFIEDVVAEINDSSAEPEFLAFVEAYIVAAIEHLPAKSS